MASFNFFREGRKASQLQRSEQEDFSFNGKTTKGALLYGEIPFGGKLNVNSINIKPTGSASFVSWHPSGRFLAIGHATDPYISVYYFSGSALIKIPNPATKPAGSINGLAWSPDGKYLAVLCTSSPNLLMYSLDLTGSTPALSLAYSTSSIVAFDISWAPDSKYFVVVPAAFFTTVSIIVYSFDGVEATLVAQEILPNTKSGWRVSASWSPSGRYIAVASTGDSSSTQVRLTLFIYGGGGLLLKVLEVSGTNIPEGPAVQARWSPTEQYLSLAHEGGKKSTVYKYTPPTGYSGQSIEKVPNTNLTPSGNGICTAWSSDGRHYTVGLDATPYLSVYSVEDGDLYYVLYNYVGGAPPEGTVKDISWSPNGKFVAVAHDTFPYMTLYTPGTGTIFPGNLVEVEPPSNLPHI